MNVKECNHTSERSSLVCEGYFMFVCCGFTFVFSFVKCLKDILKNYVASQISSKCNHTVEQSSTEGVQKNGRYYSNYF